MQEDQEFLLLTSKIVIINRRGKNGTIT